MVLVKFFQQRLKMLRLILCPCAKIIIETLVIVEPLLSVSYQWRDDQLSVSRN